MSMVNFDWNQCVKEVIDRTEFMSMSTLGNDGIWANPVQFSYDEKLNLYSKSMPQSKHMQNLQKNSVVAVAIYSTNKFESGDVAGIQLNGKAKILKSREDVERAAKHHYERNRPEERYASRIKEHLGTKAAWNFFL